MSKVVSDTKRRNRRSVSFENGVTLQGSNHGIAVILALVDRLGKALQPIKEEKRGRDQGCDRVRKGSPAKPGRKSNTMPKVQGWAGSKRQGA